jgi:hypothetical protein
LLTACLFLQGDRSASARQRPVQADDGSIAIGGDVRDGTIQLGLDERAVGERMEILRDRTGSPTVEEAQR